MKTFKPQINAALPASPVQDGGALSAPEISITASKLAGYVYARDNERSDDEYFTEFTNPQISAKGRATMLLSSLTAENISSYTTVNGEIAGNNLLIKPDAAKAFREYLESVNSCVPIHKTVVYHINGVTVHFKTAQFWLTPDLQYIYRRVSGSGQAPDLFDDLAQSTFGLIASDGRLRYDYIPYVLNTKSIVTRIEPNAKYTTYYPCEYHLERIENELTEMVYFFKERNKLELLTG